MANEDESLERTLARGLGGLEDRLGLAAPAVLRGIRRRSARRRLAAGAALAGVVAAVVVFMSIAPTPVAERPSRADAEATAKPTTDEPIEVDALIAYRDLDDGDIYICDQPVRQIRRQVVHTYRWFDPQQKTHVRLTVPHEQVVFVSRPLQ